MIEQKITFKKHLSHMWPYMSFLAIMGFIVLYDWANPVANNRAIYIIYAVSGFVSILNIT